MLMCLGDNVRTLTNLATEMDCLNDIQAFIT